MQVKLDKKLILLLCLSFIYLSLDINYGINIYDEGVPLVGAMKVLQGDFPYFDYWTLYAPGVFFINAFSIDLFGDSLITQRYFSIFIQVLIVLFTFLISKRINSKTSFQAGVFVAIILGGFDIWGRSVLYSILFTLIGIFFYVNYFDTKKTKHLFLAFLIFGLNVLFRHFIGGLLLVLVTTFTASFYKKLNLTPLKLLIVCILGALPSLLFLIFYVDDANLLSNLLLHNPINVFPEYRELSLSNAYFESIKLFAISMVMLLITIIIGLFNLVLIFEVFRKNNNFGRILILIGVFTFSFLYSVRSDLDHMMPAILLSVIYLSVIRLPYKLNFYLIIIFLAFPLKNKLSDLNTYYSNSSKIELAQSEIYLKNNYAKEYSEILNHLKGKEFFSCGWQNDRIILNDVLIYFLVGYVPDFYYYELHPGITTESRAQERIISEIQSINYILALKNEFTEQNKSRKSSKIFLLDQYIKDNFNLELQTESYKIFKRNQK